MIVSPLAHRVVPARQYRAAPQRPRGGHAAPPLHRHGERGGRLRTPVQRAVRRVLPLPGRRGRHDHPDGGRGDARLACGRVVLEGRDRHQFALDRHRDPEPRPLAGLPRFPAAPDGGRDRALPGHPRAPCHSRRRTCWPIPTWRRAARSTPARSSTGRCCTSRASATGLRPPRPMQRRCQRDELARASSGCWREYGYGIAVTGECDEATRKVTDAFQRHFRPARVDWHARSFGAAHARSGWWRRCPA